MAEKIDIKSLIKNNLVNSIMILIKQRTFLEQEHDVFIPILLLH